MKKKVRDDLFNSVKRKECGIIAFRFDNKIAYRRGFLDARHALARQKKAKESEREREKNYEKEETARNGTELAYISSHFARFHGKRNQRNLCNAKI